MEEEKMKIYHERQRLQFCLLHSLNNLFQGKNAFTRSDLNSIAEKLDVDDPNRGRWNPVSIVFRPHHNEITGNYDINVLIVALEQKGKTVVWHDKRNGASSIDLDGTDDRLMGIVLNVPVRKFSGLWRSRHWVTLRCIQGVWYNLDSDFAAPYAFKDTQQVREFLDGIITAGAEVLLIMNDKQ
ncbi:josephin-like protein [Solanum dulcamara]|uniref:josephin-like protein n=1 Tax=Solanum dulcamara TaxID=45834 RepID=UPI0024863B45|nr:josephin-like protein [Solanum dulcamara]